MSSEPPPAAYVLGHSDAEIRRLELQARRIDPLTRRIFTAAGVAAGMRVLDVGSGAGDVALLVADLVGTDGEVVGFDRSASALDIAREKVAARSLTNVTFVAGAADEVRFDQPFDAVVGRYVLQFQTDPSAMLATVASFARPGGVIAFHEIDWSGVSSTPRAPTFDSLHTWLEQAISRSGANTHSGLSLPAVFRGAGLPEPELRLESLIGAGIQAKVAVERMVGLATSLLPVLTAEGIVSADELGIDTLFDRMMAEIVADHVLIRSHLEIGAWSRTAE
jgi:SAM-dependent methyltransferase